MNAHFGAGDEQSLPSTNYGPFFHPDGKRIIFASNVNGPKGPNFDLYIVILDGAWLEQVTPK